MAIVALHAAISLDDLRALPGNHLEKLKGDREGQYSIRINNQWRSALHGSMTMLKMLKSLIITNPEKEAEMTEKIPPVHPGEVLEEDYLIPLGISQYQLAKSMRVPPPASMKSYAANEPLLPKPPYAWPVPLAHPLTFGLIYR